MTVPQEVKLARHAADIDDDGHHAGGACDHQHATDEFTAAGDTPETFTLERTPLGVRRVHLNGSRLAAADVGGTGRSVEVETVASDIVIVDYEAGCVAPGSAPIDGPGLDLDVFGDDTVHVNQISEPFSAEAGQTITIDWAGLGPGVSSDWAIAFRALVDTSGSGTGFGADLPDGSFSDFAPVTATDYVVFVEHTSDTYQGDLTITGTVTVT